MTSSGVTTRSVSTLFLNLYKGNTLVWRRRAEDGLARPRLIAKTYHLSQSALDIDRAFLHEHRANFFRRHRSQAALLELTDDLNPETACLAHPARIGEVARLSKAPTAGRLHNNGSRTSGTVLARQPRPAS